MCQSLSQNLLLSFRISGVCVCVRVCVACACISWTCRFVDEAITLKQKKKDLAEEKVDLQLLWCRREIEKKCTFFEKKINNGAANTLHSAGNVQVRDLYIDIHIVQDTYIHTPRQKREQIQETSSAPCYRSGYRQEYWLSDRTCVRQTPSGDYKARAPPMDLMHSCDDGWQQQWEAKKRDNNG